MGHNKPKFLTVTWTPDTEKLRALNFFFMTRFVFSDIFYTSGIEMSQHFPGPFGPLVVSFCELSSNFEGDFKHWL